MLRHAARKGDDDVARQRRHAAAAPLGVFRFAIKESGHEPEIRLNPQDLANPGDAPTERQVNVVRRFLRIDDRRVSGKREPEKGLQLPLLRRALASLALTGPPRESTGSFRNGSPPFLWLTNSRRKSRPIGDAFTSPAASGLGAANPSLLANRVNVRPRPGL